jgi:tetratricopeptide (TPR) repeat protein
VRRTILIIQLIVFGAICVVASLAFGQTDADWQPKVEAEVKIQHLDAALAIVNQRLAEVPDDYEAHGWRGRLLSWKGRWSEGEAEYKLVLANYPNDIDILTALSDVLLWQQKYTEALKVLDQANAVSPSDPEILSRQARVLTALGRDHEARTEYQQLLEVDPQNKEAKASLLEATKHELRIENDTDFFNFANDAETQEITVSSRWDRRWSTVASVSTYQRFGQDAVRFMGSGDFHVTTRTWAGVGAAIANAQSVVPTNETFFELGHGFHFDNRLVQGLDSSYQQHWFWYQGAHVLTLTGSGLVYLPRGWTWSLNVIGARSGFTGTPAGWEPAGWSKLTFPLYHRLSGNVSYGVGSENFSQIDQISQFSAHTYGGGLSYRFSGRQDIQGFLARQYRSQGLIDTTMGLSYGIRF